MDKMLSYKEAAIFLGIPVGTLYAMVCRGKIACHRYSNRLVRFSQVELDQWKASHRREVDPKNVLTHEVTSDGRDDR